MSRSGVYQWYLDWMPQTKMPWTEMCVYVWVLEVSIWVVVFLCFGLLVMHLCFVSRFIQISYHNKIILNSFLKGIWLWLLVNELSLMLEVLIGFDGWHLHPQYYKIYITVFTHTTCNSLGYKWLGAAHLLLPGADNKQLNWVMVLLSYCKWSIQSPCRIESWVMKMREFRITEGEGHLWVCWMLLVYVFDNLR